MHSSLSVIAGVDMEQSNQIKKALSSHLAASSCMVDSQAEACAEAQEANHEGHERAALTKKRYLDEALQALSIGAGSMYMAVGWLVIDGKNSEIEQKVVSASHDDAAKFWFDNWLLWTHNGGSKVDSNGNNVTSVIKVTPLIQAVVERIHD